MKNENDPGCSRCPYDWSERYCRKEGGKAPPDCPSIRHREAIGASLEELKKPEVLEFARRASIQEASGYGGREKGYARIRPIKPRIVETMEFARGMGYRRLALVFCIGLRHEAAVVHDLFEGHGFETVSVACKVGRVPKEALGLSEDEKIVAGQFETMCNPIAQALVANRCKADFNVLLGLCVGHDSLFFKYAEAPTTVLAVKDRLLGHNPLAAIYQVPSYYRSLKEDWD